MLIITNAIMKVQLRKQLHSCSMGLVYKDKIEN